MPPALTKADLARLDAWFHHESSLPDIARTLGLPVVELADWAAQPHIKASLASVKKVAEDRNDLLHVQAKHCALHRLTSLVTHAENTESARKAATRILMTRLDDQPRRHAPASLPPTDPTPQAPPQHAASQRTSSPAPPKKAPASQPPHPAAPSTHQLPAAQALDLPLIPPIGLPGFSSPIDLLPPKPIASARHPLASRPAALFARAGAASTDSS